MGNLSLFLNIFYRFVDDYANTIRALIDLYQVTFDPAHLEWAVELQSRQDEQFWDENAKGYFTSAAGNCPYCLPLILQI